MIGIIVFSSAVLVVLGIAVFHRPNKKIDDLNDLIRGGGGDDAANKKG